ncbi:MAG TPA: hypothetical protein VFG61_00165 [Gaiellaceae bacterium]|nr:hypothetical protein [Gaiellaceae bacterium]
MNHLLDGPLRQHERLGNRRVVLPLGHLAQHITLARSEVVERRVVFPRVLRDQRLHDLGIHDRAAGCDRVDCRNELVEILHPLLQKVRAALASTLQKREHEGRGRVLAQHDHTNLGARLAESGGRLDSLVRVLGRHADVRDDDVGPLGLDRLEQRVEVLANRRDLEVVSSREQAAQGLADEVVVFGEHESDRHVLRIRR